ncbi:MAG: methyltransferase domain-containing protein [Candidatus Sungbacteria bacterium]|nr:methyltransferase domain-containing protein [Candidatus Sungbacteria bacterium]
MIYIYLFLIVILVIGAAIFLWFLIWTVIIGDLRGAPFVASRRNKIRLMCDLAQIRPGMAVADLGSGDGSILLEAARRGAKAIGLEINPFLVWFSRLRAKRRGLHEKITVLRRDFYTYPLDKIDVIFVYLWPETMKKLREKFLSECRPGTRIVSNAFPIKGWRAIMEKEGVYVYEIKNAQNPDTHKT